MVALPVKAVLNSSGVVSVFLTVGECLSCSFKLEDDDMPFRRDVRPVLEVNSHGHSSVAFVNKVFIGNLELAPPFFPCLLLLSCFSFPWFPDFASWGVETR